MPSSRAIDHQPFCTCKHTLAFFNEILEEEDDQGKDEAKATVLDIPSDLNWSLGGLSISDLCFEFKTSTIKLAKNVHPAQLSDIRLLAMNSIYPFDIDDESSVTKYFPSQVAALLLPTFSFRAHLPEEGEDSHAWCRKLEISPLPQDYMSSMTIASPHSQILSMLINGPPDDTNEDSFVHWYLSPLLSSVFGSERCLKMKWANSQLTKINNNAFKPDFIIYNITGITKCVVLNAEFKPTEHNSYVESDLVKLAKQMKDTLTSSLSKE